MLKEIYERQSIRKYKDVKVDEEVINEILRAGMNAPTARNLQTWKYIVVENKEVLNEISTFTPSMSMMKEATFAIIVLGDRKLDDNDIYLYVNASASIENMLIEGVNQGLGSCWCAIGPNEDRVEAFRNYFKIEDDLVPVACVSFGVSNETKEKVDRYDENKVAWIK